MSVSVSVMVLSDCNVLLYSVHETVVYYVHIVFVAPEQITKHWFFANLIVVLHVPVYMYKATYMYTSCLYFHVTKCGFSFVCILSWMLF